MPQWQVLFFSVVYVQRNVFFPTFLLHLVNCSLFKDNGILIEIVSMDLGKGSSISVQVQIQVQEMMASMAKGSAAWT